MSVRSVRVVPWVGAGRVASATSSWAERRGLVLAVVDDAGRIGLGEASPLPGFSPDDLAAANATLSGLDVTVLERAVTQLEDARRAGPAPALVALSQSVGPAPSDSASATFALETALLDLVAQRAGLSLAAWLTGGESRPIARSVLVGGLDDGLEERALRAVARGAAHLKLKVTGLELETEAARLRALRAKLGAGVELRLDLNGACDGPGAVRAAATFSDAGAACVEEPTSGEALLSLGPLALPWLVDESLASPELRARFVDAPACAGLVLKPTLLGGFAVSLQLAAQARSRGKQVVVTHAFEGPIALAAAAELALACAADLAGLDAHAALGPGWEDAVVTLPERGEPLAVVDVARVGLGLASTARARLAALAGQGSS